MSWFPAVDPIPLPAPVWLFKGLHAVMLSLHFVAVEMLLGGLLVAAGLSWLGTARRRSGDAVLHRNAAAVLARRLPVVMTYVINLGVPPLLFAQVLYGRALYTSSVLIGLYWLSVVFLLMLCYWMLYRFQARLAEGRPGWWIALIAWVAAAAIARIYSSNMTLMLRPEVWGPMYSASAVGLHLPQGDPTLLPRWLFMLTGGLAVAGLWMLWLAGRRCAQTPVADHLAKLGGRVALVASLAQLAVGFWVVAAQPQPVRAALLGNLWYQGAGFGWLMLMGSVALLGLWAGLGRPMGAQGGWLAMLLGVLAIVCAAVFREGVRDVTLLGKGLDVWQRTVVTNWSVVGLFLILFVAGLGAVAWLIAVMRRAKPVVENVA